VTTSLGLLACAGQGGLVWLACVLYSRGFSQTLIGFGMEG